MCEMMHNFGIKEKKDLWFQFQEHMNITHSECLQSYVGTCVWSMTEA